MRARVSWPCCELLLGHLTAATGTGEWTRSVFRSPPAGEVQIVNTNGKLEIEAGDGSTVEVRAERVARGSHRQAARELLPNVTSRKTASPTASSLETERMTGILSVSSFEVNYHVRSPLGAGARPHHQRRRRGHRRCGESTAHTTNGGVTGRA